MLVGAFMVGGLATLGLLLVMFGEAPEWLGGAEWELKITVDQLRGASQGTPVNLNGVQIGRVDKLVFNDPKRPDLGVSIIALIRDEYDVPGGADAVIYEPALGLGRGRIEINVEPDSAGAPVDHKNACIRGEMGRMFGEIVDEALTSDIKRTIRQIGDFAQSLTPVAGDLHELFKVSTMEEVDDPARGGRTLANLFTAVQRLDQTLKHANEVLGDPEVQSALREAIHNLRQATDDGRLALADFRAAAAIIKDSSARIATKIEVGVDDATANVQQLSRKAMPALDNIAELTANLNRASLMLADGEGTAGKLLRDDRLYEALVLCLKRITEMVDTIGRIAEKSERQGYIDVAENKRVPGVPLPAKLNLYDPHQPTREGGGR